MKIYKKVIIVVVVVCESHQVVKLLNIKDQGNILQTKFNLS